MAATPVSRSSNSVSGDSRDLDASFYSRTYWGVGGASSSSRSKI